MELPIVNRNKWLVRTGSLLVLVGFILPSVLVSCAGAPELGHALSLYDIASLLRDPLLYLVPIGGLAVLTLAFLPTLSVRETLIVFWGQVAGTIAGIVGIVLPLISLSSQLQTFGYKLSPEVGMLSLAAGFALIGVGLTGQWHQERAQLTLPRRSPDRPATVSANYSSSPQPQPPVYLSLAVPECYDNQVSLQASLGTPSQFIEQLRLVRGRLPVTVISLTHDGFSIGRDPNCDLHLPERDISRQHARLRFGQGSWFIQDMNSAGGIRVNGKVVLAHRLEEGDEVAIGEYLFRFCKKSAASGLK
jgi:hypothetical protein